VFGAPRLITIAKLREKLKMEHVNWGLPVALDLFFAALGAGAFMLAVVVDFAGGKKYRGISTTGALIAPWPAIIGVILLVADLGKPHRFWEMIFRRGEGFIMFNPSSVMSWGVWLLTIFIILSLVYLVLSILSWPFAWGDPAKKLIGVIGLPFALLVTVYTGVLLSATTITLWSTPVLPIMFVTSAIATGAASVVFIQALIQPCKKEIPADSPIIKLEKLISLAIIVQLVAIVLFILLRIGSAQMQGVIGAVYGPVWWIVVIGLGLVLPLIFGLKAQAKKPQISLVMALLVLVGGFFLRYIILMAGQTL